MRIAMIKNNIVENIADWDGIYEWKPEGYILIDVSNIPCEIGSHYDGKIFILPKQLD